MTAGSKYGDRKAGHEASSAFSIFIDDEGGYTTVAVATALLASLSLVFALATAQWSLSRAADVQEVADAAALAGANAVSAFSTVAQVIDACVLTLGITGMAVCAAGLIVAAIPVLQALAPPILKAGRQILDARREFARSAAEGLSRLERALPAVIAANSASCVAANSEGTVRYAGMAIPLPMKSESDFGYLDDGLDSEELEQKAEELRQASQKKAESDEEARADKERAWKADNVDDPACMRSRAETLAGLGPAANPSYPSPDVWKFDYARVRAMNYYASRLRLEAPEGDSPDLMQRSAARKAFFEYAYGELERATCIEEGDEVAIDLPDLPHTRDMVMQTTLYTDAIWPCSLEESGVVLHAYEGCPGWTGPDAGVGPLSSIDAGLCLRCDVCQMDAKAMGNVANASTNINNGFEHYWKIVVEASRAYEAASQRSREAEREMQKRADEGQGAFDRAMQILSVQRPKLCPPGAWGCVAYVCRPDSTTVPNELTSAFLSSSELPAGAAISGATLAPDKSCDESNVMRHVLDGVRERGSGDPIDLIGSVGDLWGKLLVGYGSAFEGATSTLDGFFDQIGGVFGERVAQGLKEGITGTAKKVFEAAGLLPADVSLRKPVLVNSQTVLDKAGMSAGAQARQLIEAVPTDPEQFAAEQASKAFSELGQGTITIAELPIPGLDGVTIPLTIDLSKLWGAS